MPASTRASVALLALLGLLAGACGERRAAEPPAEARDAEVEPRHGGRLVVAMRNEPRTFNPVYQLDNPTRTVLGRLHADLVDINAASQRTEPALAESVEVSSDGRRLTVTLRDGLRFSDGEPMDADDVVFTYQVILDEEVGAPNREMLVVGGEAMTAAKVGPLRVEFELAEPYAVGDRLFDSLPILPEHRLRAAWEEGRLAEAWGLATPPAEIAGLGPFVLSAYTPGERLVMKRNPHYWKRDAEGRALPYLDELVVLFVASEDAQAIRFQAGEVDVTDRLSSKSFAVLDRVAAERGLRMEDLGAGLGYEMLFFNLNDLSGQELPAIAAKQPWFRDGELRRAVSEAIDRRALARLVYEGRATPLAGHVTPGNKLWRDPGLEPREADPEAARRRLEAAGYRAAPDGALIAPDGARVELTLVTNSSNRERVAMATVIQQDLDRLGIAVEVAPLEFRALLERVFSSFDYELCLLGLGGGDVDPNSDIPVLHSQGDSHLWDLSAERFRPPWQRRIDELLEQQLSVLDVAERRRLYFEVQRLVATELPLVPLVSPNVLVGARRELGNFRPAVLDHPSLWNVDELFWRRLPARPESEKKSPNSNG